jgi:hypothetical protein
MTGMSRSRWPALLTTLTVLFAGLGGVHAHAHLCFDGQATPISLPAHEHADHDHHHEPDANGDHDDVDVDVESQALLKSLDHDMAAITAAPLSWLMPDRGAQTARAVRDGTEPRGPPPHALPPPRAPPR